MTLTGSISTVARRRARSSPEIGSAPTSRVLSHCPTRAASTSSAQSGNTIGGTIAGAGNTIAFNYNDAIDIIAGTANSILEDLIFGNGAGIVLASGGNDDQAAPVITGVTSQPTGATSGQTVISVDLTGPGFNPGTTYSLDFFASEPSDPTGGVEAHIYLGTATFTGGNTGTFTTTSLLSPSQYVTATATLISGTTFTDTGTFATSVEVVEAFSFIVTTTASTGPGSLEQAIEDADADTSNPNPDSIGFDITTGSAPYIIDNLPNLGLSEITRPVLLLANTQPGYAGTPIVILDGTGTGNSGLYLTSGADGTVIVGFDLINFTGSPFIDAIAINANDVIVQGNYIGVETDGRTAAANSGGIFVDGSGATIGGTSAGAGNLISGNTQIGVDLGLIGSTGDVIEGNEIGTDITGTLALPNGYAGVYDSGSLDSTIGGTATGAGNLISGNVYGVFLDAASGNLIAGNRIGTDTTGTIALPNDTGVYLDQSPDNLIGGSVTGAGNLISGNTQSGIYLYGSATTGTIIVGNMIGTSFSLSNTAKGIYDLNAPDNTIGGTVSGDSNLISGNSDGIYIKGTSASGNVVVGNRIGTDLTGTLAVGNEIGVFLSNAPGNLIGGSVSGDSNLISGNVEYGIDLYGGGTTGTIIAGNKIGTDITGTLALSDSIGVTVVNAPGNTIGGIASGDSNLISGNANFGIEIVNAGSSGNVIVGNEIGTDITGTLALPNQAGVVIIHAGDTMIGGTVTGDGNLISGNSDKAVYLYGSDATDSLIAGNKIGTDITGTRALPNASGLWLETGASNNTVGGTTAGAGNLISGNSGVGLYLFERGTDNNLVVGNKIGTDVSGTLALPNSVGIADEFGSDNTIGGTVAGAGNTIAFNTVDAINIFGAFDGTDNPILENLIFGNGAGIVLQSGGNDNQAAPVITGVMSQATGASSAETIISVDLTGPGFTPGATYSLDFFASEPTDPSSGDQAHIYLGTESFIGGTTGTFSLMTVPPPLFSTQSVTATATLLSGTTYTDTSEFASAVVVVNGFDFTVTTTAATGAGSLEQAIQDADADTVNPNADVIGFAITPSSATYVISLPSGGLSPITRPVLLYANSQPGYAGTPIVVLDGTGVSGNGLVLAAGSDGSAISGLDIIDFSGDGMEVDSGGNVVQSNYVGVQTDGMTTAANSDGIFIFGSNNTIGGTGAGTGNLISGNFGVGVVVSGGGATGNVIAGNRIGTDFTGTRTAAHAQANGVEIVNAPDNTIGGSVSGDSNVISGNQDGIYLAGSGTTGTIIVGNKIGTDITGTVALGNVFDGVEVGNAPGNMIGGTSSGDANLISGNKYGIFLYGSGTEGTTIAGNMVGTDVTGTVALPNATGIEVWQAPDNTIGGTGSGYANLISGNTYSGIYLKGSGTTGTIIAGNQIGTDVTGTRALPNEEGVLVGNAPDNTIGGSVSGDSNLISGNSGDGIYLYGSGTTDTIIVGNKIGTDITGTLAVGNANDGVVISQGASDNTIGGTAFGDANLISGNNNSGIYLDGAGTTGNVIAGNEIGTDITGTLALSNQDGVKLEDAPDNTIGGSAPGDSNLISGNRNSGIYLNDAGTTGTFIAGNKIGTDITGTRALGGGGVIVVNAPDNTIGGSASGDSNLISGSGGRGVYLVGSGTIGTIVAGNKIGTDITGTIAVGNGNIGVVISQGASDNTIGGTSPGSGNLISGNNGGVSIDDGGTTGNVVAGNQIGTDITGTLALGNASYGVQIVNAPDTTIGGSVSGDANLISGNTGDGIDLYGAATTGTIIAGNRIGTDITGTLALPNVTGIYVLNAPGNLIGGTASGDANLISGNVKYGIFLYGSGTTGTLIAGNMVGTDVTGTVALPNATGIYVENAPDSTIGGTASGDANLISGNTKYGIYLKGSGTTDTLVAGNRIGTDITGALALGNGGAGVQISTGPSDNTDNTIGGTVAGAGNTIAFNTGSAVVVLDAGGNAILEDLIFDNGGGGIVLENGGNDDQAAPVITDVTSKPTGGASAEAIISVDLTGAGFTPGASYSLDFFASEPTDPNSGVQAHIYLGTATFIGGTTGTFTDTSLATALVSSQQVTATATLLSGTTYTDTSEFATEVVVADVFDFTVMNTASSGPGSLEQAILDADADSSNPNADVIGFAITPTGATYTITPGSGGLSTITRPVILFASSQPGYLGTPIVVLDGTGVSGSGLVLSAGSDGSAILGFDIVNFTTAGTYGIEIESNDDAVQGNYVGVETGGNTAAPNVVGIYVTGSDNTIGGTSAGSGNLVSGNTSDGVELVGSTGDVVAGNMIGTNNTGKVALGNNRYGIWTDFSADNTIGGTSAGAGNLISGNGLAGIELQVTNDTLVVGNKIGTDITGKVALASPYGVYIDEGTGNTVGGTTSVASNLISGNQYAGIEIVGSGDVIAGNRIGTDITGTVALSDGDGVWLQQSSGNTIGGSVAGAGNLISGNFEGFHIIYDAGELIVGNMIGTNVTGSAALPNTYGVYIVNSTDSTIGGSISAESNLISGNTDAGVFVYQPSTSGILVIGDRIGTDITGTLAVPNRVGVDIENSPDNTIGGTVSGDSNLISGNSYSGVFVYGTSSTGTIVVGNEIGTDITGTLALSDSHGVTLYNAPGDMIGGSVSGDSNLISGNSSIGVFLYGSSTTGTIVAGNEIGTDITETLALPNFDGVFIQNAADNTIGGSVSGDTNLISGNTIYGIFVTGAAAKGNLIAGNLIGSDPTGTLALPNFVGVRITDAADNTIGGGAAGAGNLISGNTDFGIELDGSGTTGTIVVGNQVGTDITGTIALPDQTGVYIAYGATDNTIGGLTSTPGTDAGNLISGNRFYGIEISQSSSGNVIVGNEIGTDITGTTAVINGIGVWIDGVSANTIGGTSPGAANLISGNNYGIEVSGSGATGTVIEGNEIGTDITGTIAVPNLIGIYILAGGTGNTVGGSAAGAGNLISGNTVAGVGIYNISPDNLIEGNRIGTDTTGTLALPNAIGVEINDSPGNTIGGSVSGDANLISGNTTQGIYLYGAGTTGTIIAGNKIGTDITGTLVVAEGYGVEVVNAPGNMIGGTSSGDGNLISGARFYGISLEESGTTGTIIVGNRIGTDITGTLALPNFAGIRVYEAPDNTIGGSVAGAGNLISGNASAGIDLADPGATANLIVGNRIGTDITGTLALPNPIGIFVGAAAGNTIGGIASGDGNLISGNTDYGVELYDFGVLYSSATVVAGNLIGTDVTGTLAVGNGTGVYIWGSASDNTIGGDTASAANVISGNTGYGIQVDGASTTGNVLDDNFVGTGAERGRHGAQRRRSPGDHRRRRRAGSGLVHGQRAQPGHARLLRRARRHHDRRQLHAERRRDARHRPRRGLQLAVRPAPGLRHRHPGGHARGQPHRRLLDRRRRGVPGPVLRPPLRDLHHRRLPRRRHALSGLHRRQPDPLLEPDRAGHHHGRLGCRQLATGHHGHRRRELHRSPRSSSISPPATRATATASGPSSPARPCRRSPSRWSSTATRSRATPARRSSSWSVRMPARPRRA